MKKLNTGHVILALLIIVVIAIFWLSQCSPTPPPVKPTPTKTPTATLVPTATKPTVTKTELPESTNTPTATYTPTNTATLEPTATFTPTPEPTTIVVKDYRWYNWYCRCWVNYPRYSWHPKPSNSIFYK